MSKKQLEINSIQNELAGGASLYFQPKPSQTQIHHEAKNERSNERTTERTNVRTMKKQERVKVRHSFDVYRDQLVELQSLQLTAVRRGKRKPKLGDMVQAAIDFYLEKKKA